jgi:hypothetical protein
MENCIFVLSVAKTLESLTWVPKKKKENWGKTLHVSKEKSLSMINIYGTSGNLHKWKNKHKYGVWKSFARSSCHYWAPKNPFYGKFCSSERANCGWENVYILYVWELFNS